MNLETLSNISQIVSAVTVVGASAFALIQLSELKKQRRDAIAGELMRTFMDSDLAHALTLIMALPDDMPGDKLSSAGPEVEQAAVLISTRFETMGLLVHERIAPLDLVVELAGGIVVVTWRRLAPWMEHIRQRQSQPSWAEWYQWLAEQCKAHKGHVVPAYQRSRNWKP
jgi:hypothetical protein